MKTSISSLASEIGLAIEYEYTEDGDIAACRAVDGIGRVVCHAKDEGGIRDWLESDVDGEWVAVDRSCIDCGDEGNHVRDDWELLDGKRLCCHCASDRLSECRVPQEWQFDGE